MISNTMSSLFRSLLCMFMMVTVSHAQTDDPTVGPRGFIRLMNAVGVGSGKLDFLIDGTRVRDEGYQFGDVTGGIPRKPASYKVAFRRTGIEPGETKVDVLRDETTTLIPFAEYVPATEKKEAHWIIRILRLKQSESREKSTATIVNLTRKPELKVQIQQPDESWVTLSVKRLALDRATILQRTGYVPMRTESGDLKPLSVGTSGNFIAVVYEDAAGAICSQNFQDFKYLSIE
jgi:phage pi2 protein 07